MDVGPAPWIFHMLPLHCVSLVHAGYFFTILECNAFYRNLDLLVYICVDRIPVKVELEFLKPHIPTLEEKADPMLFASNVRKEMATALGIQLCDLRWPCLLVIVFVFV